GTGTSRSHSRRWCSATPTTSSSSSLRSADAAVRRQRITENPFGQVLGFGTFSHVASSFDPFGLVRLAEQTVGTGVKVANWYERQVFGYLRSRMDAVTPPAPPLPPSPAKIAESLDAKMHTLLDRAI